MRALAGLVVALLLVGGIYYFCAKRMPTAAEGTASTQAISLTGVQADLLQIAQGERAYMTLNGRCASLDELVSSRTVLVARPERDGYTYTIECSGAEFTVTARHAPGGSAVRYPPLRADQTLQVREIQ